MKLIERIFVFILVLLAVAVPTIAPFIGLLGAFCFSILGLLIPVFIETVTYWDIGFGPGNWVAIKNVIICIIGVLALVFGSRSALIEIIDMYMRGGESSNSLTNQYVDDDDDNPFLSDGATTIANLLTNATLNL